MCVPGFVSFFFFNDTATTEIYTLSLHDALPISCRVHLQLAQRGVRTLAGRGRSRRLCPYKGSRGAQGLRRGTRWLLDRKSTRLNSSHANISYAVFCLKKKKPDIDI